MAYYMRIFFGNGFVRFVLTFLALHTVSWSCSVLYSDYCLDRSFVGFFRNMVNGHGPVCHTLQTISTTAVDNIYTLLRLSVVTTGVSWVIDSVRGTTTEG